VRHYNTTCSDYIHPVIHIADEYLNFFEADRNFEHFENQTKICPVNKVLDGKNIIVADVEKDNIKLIFIAIPIMFALILGIAYAFKKCAPYDFIYLTKR
jgi:hypothetical protein